MPYPSALRDEDRNLAIKLSSIQEQFYTCATRFSLFIGGIGSGKTTAGAARAVSYALDHPGSLGLVGAPTYTMLRDTSQRTLLALLPPSSLLSFSETAQEPPSLEGGQECATVRRYHASEDAHVGVFSESVLYCLYGRAPHRQAQIADDA